MNKLRLASKQGIECGLAPTPDLMTAKNKIPRLTDISFPERPYLPGTGMIHPGKDPANSHIPQIPPPAIAFDVETWRFSQHYLYAIDLFNYRYWWEAHEVLEDVWIEAGKNTPGGKFIQGIIQISAALLKTAQSQAGTRRLAAKGLSKIRLQSGVFLGVDVHEFGLQVTTYIEGKVSAPPEIKLRFPE
jgi:hypothetical protein